MNDRIQAVVFVLSAMVLAAVYGIFAQSRGWFPAPQIMEAEVTIKDVAANWRNDLELEPTRHLVEIGGEGRAETDTGFRLHRPDAVTPGYTVIAGLSKDQERAAFSVTLFDEEGQPRHVWPVDYSLLDPEGLKPLNVMLHGMEVLEDGSIVVSFDAGNVIARLDACGSPMWIEKGGYHHSIIRDDAGDLWAWRDNTITRLSAETGKVAWTMSLEEEILMVNGKETGAIALRTYIGGQDQKLAYTGDPFHANDVEPLSARMAAAFPQFEAGDLLVSMRELNMIGVVDPENGHLKWWQHGPWLKQHDPDFQPNGTITIYDNASGTGTSNIYQVDPKTHATQVLFTSGEVPFYSWQRGKHQVLESGNILITEAQRGRVFEVTPDGDPVWERDMIWDATRNLVVTEARHIPSDFFTVGIPRCTPRSGG